MYPWQKDYLSRISKMTNEEVLEEYTDLTQGDDYDGGRTSKGDWKYPKIDEELHKRLKECGFLK
jgi:hypothetical protein